MKPRKLVAPGFVSVRGTEPLLSVATRFRVALDWKAPLSLLPRSCR
jgi:hypothetical protein